MRGYWSVLSGRLPCVPFVMLLLGGCSPSVPLADRNSTGPSGDGALQDGNVTGDEPESGGVTGDNENDNSDSANDDGSDADNQLLSIEYCVPTVGWDAGSAAFEEQVLELVNERRAQGADCGSNGAFGAADALTHNEKLRCAARRHSQDMSARNFFDHTNPDGEGPRERIEAAEYDWIGWGENIAFGQRSPQQVVDAWMTSDGHCANIMNPSFDEIGIGYFTSNHWTQVFGAPR